MGKKTAFLVDGLTKVVIGLLWLTAGAVGVNISPPGWAAIAIISRSSTHTDRDDLLFLGACYLISAFFLGCLWLGEWLERCAERKKARVLDPVS